MSEPEKAKDPQQFTAAQLKQVDAMVAQAIAKAEARSKRARQPNGPPTNVIARTLNHRHAATVDGIFESIDINKHINVIAHGELSADEIQSRISVFESYALHDARNVRDMGRLLEEMRIMERDQRDLEENTAPNGDGQ